MKSLKDSTPLNYKKEQFLKSLLVTQLCSKQEVFWSNPKLLSVNSVLHNLRTSLDDIVEADKCLQRFSPYLMTAFPELQSQKGIIESPLIEALSFAEDLSSLYQKSATSKLYLKLDNVLPVSGSIKARGGIFAVLKFAEKLAIEKLDFSINSDYKLFGSQKFKSYFKKYSLVVGSTGNLGLSIGIIGRKLGFSVTIHMSTDAKEWKKRLLRSLGAKVVEHNGDYSAAVYCGRQEAEENDKAYFIDDENSYDLFLGYSVAALRLKNQLEQQNILVSPSNPLNVFLPCGVGGAPAGICVGLKYMFGDNVNCYFAEPIAAPAMLIGLASGLHNEISVNDIGIKGGTEADGLNVLRPSNFAGKEIESLVKGCYTVSDENLFRLLSKANEHGIKVEPSAAAGIYGPFFLANELEGISIAWLTGGSLIPDSDYELYCKKGYSLLTIAD